ncbi:MAG: hypothetical protein PUG10_12185 [Lachnospiraceae bacterium]|nr:hypothetical protein [Lachnospiraceae bacterium]
MNIDPSGNTSLGEMVTTLAAMPEVQCISVVVLTCLFGALVGAADAYLGGGDKNEIIQGALKGISAAALLGCIITTIAFFIPLAPLIAACALFAVDAVLITFGAIGVVVSIKEGKPLQAIFRGMMLAVAVVF